MEITHKPMDVTESVIDGRVVFDEQVRHAETKAKLRLAHNLLAQAVDAMHQTAQAKECTRLLMDIRDHMGDKKFKDALGGEYCSAYYND